jgi:ferredoxin
MERVVEMKANVDKNLCIGCGLCESICPKVFKMDDDGKAVATKSKIDTASERDVKDAEAQCPVEAINTEE